MLSRKEFFAWVLAIATVYGVVVVLLGGLEGSARPNPIRQAWCGLAFANCSDLYRIPAPVYIPVYQPPPVEQSVAVAEEEVQPTNVAALLRPVPLPQPKAAKSAPKAYDQVKHHKHRRSKENANRI